VSGQLHAPAALLPRESAPGTHYIGGWVGCVWLSALSNLYPVTYIISSQGVYVPKTIISERKWVKLQGYMW